MPQPQTSPVPLPDRACGTCTLCCRLPDIDALDKPANKWCRHCVAEHGCMIYADRPKLCRDFECLWRTDLAFGNEWEPARCHMMIYRQGPQLTVLVDPEHPDAWLAEPHGGALRALARQAEADGGYVIVFVGEAVFKVEPDART